MKSWLPIVVFAILWLPLIPAASNTEQLLMLDLEPLLNVEVTSVSKKTQTIGQAAAAVFVITQDDIRRSGARTLPDVLRMAPGLQVASFNAHTWAVTVRGFSDLYANKLLVLLDGRTVYSWEFTGTRWYIVNTLLEDIDRIEVIRGPGGTLWGTNAVNGVINILTKPAEKSRGGLVSLGSGDLEQRFGAIRYGGVSANTATAWRVFAQAQQRDSLADSLAANHWYSKQAGIDGARDGGHRWTVEADALSGMLHDMYWDTRQPARANFARYFPRLLRQAQDTASTSSGSEKYRLPNILPTAS